jgi:hypothetical protein
VTSFVILVAYKKGMTLGHAIDSTRFSNPIFQPDPSLPLRRLKEMGFPISIQPAEDWLSANQLFPWHSIFVVNSPDRTASGGSEHLGLALVRRRYGLVFDVENNARPAHILSCNLPVGTPDEAAHLLCEEALTFNGNRREPLKVAALHGLAHLEFRARFKQPVQRGRFLQVLNGLDIKDEDDATRSALHLIARHRLTEAIDFVTRVTCSDNCELRLSAIDALLWLGEPGMTAFQAAISKGRGEALKTLKAVESGLANDLDPMHRLLTSEDWTERNGATRVLRSLVVEKGIPSAGPLEIILSRFRDDTDKDNRNSIGFCLGDLIPHIGPSALEPILALVAELQGDSEPLLNGILFGGAPGLSVGKIHDLCNAIPRINIRFRSAIHRLFAVASPDYPARIEDWLENESIQAIQWGVTPPAPVRAWFDDAAQVPGWQLVDALLRGSRKVHDGSLGSAAISASPPLAKALECLAPRLMNKGEDTTWAGVVSLLASNSTPNGIPTAWMRVALGGLKAGPPLTDTPENIGRLLAVSASALDGCADHALELLATMPVQTRSLAAYLLQTLPVGITKLQGDACNPPEHGFGPRGKEFPGLGTVQRQPPTALLESQYQQFFVSQHPRWMNTEEAIQQLVQTAKKATDTYTNHLWPWDEQDTQRLIEQIPTILIQQAIVSMHVVRTANPIACRLAQAVGPKAVEGDLGPLVAAATQNAPTEPQDTDIEHDDFDDFINGLS